LIPLSLYIHIPWCIQKCPYCDFNSHPLPDKLPASAYVKKLLADLASDIHCFDESRQLNTIFIGGGTPSLFSGEAIARLLSGIRQQISWHESIEITLEANPGALDERHFAAYRRAGVNRLSIGVQSFADSQLAQLGRVHKGSEAERAVKVAQDAGFDNINIDLMFGLPAQTLADALCDIERGIAMQTSHLSYYQLTIEPNTFFAHRPPLLPVSDAIAVQFEQASERLQAAGFCRYEVSAWSQPGKQCQHNLNYWSYGDYLGIGAGAHGKISLFDNRQQRIIRTTKPRSPKHYLQRPLLRQQRQVEAGDKAFEFMLNTLRLTEGFATSTIEERGGFSRKSIEKTLQTLVTKRLLMVDEEYISPTELGQRFVNDMVSSFLS